MNKGIFTVISNEQLIPGVHRLRLRGDTSGVTAPGQFADVLIPGCFLRRPFSVCGAEDGVLPLCVRNSGRGTALLTASAPGTELDILTGLGNGFDLADAGERPLLLGGGTGFPPLHPLCAALLALGAHPMAVLGCPSAGSAPYLDEFRALGVEPLVYTLDGSLGETGLPTQALHSLDYTSVYACGPLPMLSAIDRESESPHVQLSLEARMGCGFGACMGCTVQTISGPRRVCKDGPVFRKGEIIW